MAAVYLLLVTCTAIAQFALPRRYAFIPLILAGAHLGGVEVLPELTPARLIAVLGLLRALSGGFLIPKKNSALDTACYLFAFFALLSWVGHKPDEWKPSPFAERIGLVLNVLGTYLYGRAYLPDIQAFRRFVVVLSIALAPLGFAMAFENRTRLNLYSYIGVTNPESISRGERIRANGPFRHPILAGCAGATALPFAYLLWREGRKKLAVFATGTFMAITLASSSSGPLAAVGLTAGSIVLWRYRAHLPLLVKAGILAAIVYPIIFGRGPWYIMASIDFVGGSTGWHRAKLIDSGFTYLGEWWLWGTDYTRHWMASGMRRYPNHVDITNYYLKLGVTGGLPLMLSLVASLIIAYHQLIRRMAQMREKLDENEIVLWCAGASLAAHAVSFISIAYFDQMYVFFYLLLGAIPGLVQPSEEPSETNIKEEPALDFDSPEPPPARAF